MPTSPSPAETGVSDSHFNMWRAVFAMAHADNMIMVQEEALMLDAIERYDFSNKQKDILYRDTVIKGDIRDFFAAITDKKDKLDFFRYARLMAWCDGDFAAQEKYILEALRGEHIKTLEECDLLLEAQALFDAEEKERMKARMVEMYEALQVEKVDEGKLFEAVIDQMADSQDN